MREAIAIAEERRAEVRVDTYVIMPNHLHLIRVPGLEYGRFPQIKGYKSRMLASAYQKRKIRAEIRVTRSNDEIHYFSRHPQHQPAPHPPGSTALAAGILGPGDTQRSGMARLPPQYP